MHAKLAHQNSNSNEGLSCISRPDYVLFNKLWKCILFFCSCVFFNYQDTGSNINISLCLEDQTQLSNQPMQGRFITVLNPLLFSHKIEAWARKSQWLIAQLSIHTVILSRMLHVYDPVDISVFQRQFLTSFKTILQSPTQWGPINQ